MNFMHYKNYASSLFAANIHISRKSSKQKAIIPIQANEKRHSQQTLGL